MTNEPSAPGEAQIGKPKIVPKPWAEDFWLAHTDRYAGKILTVKKGHRLSLQYHECKHEVQYIDFDRIKLFTLGASDRPGEYREVIAGPGTVVVHVRTGRRTSALPRTDPRRARDAGRH